MWRRVLGFGLLAVLPLSACGGRVDGGSTDAGEKPTKTPTPAATSSSPPGSWSPSDNPDADTDLGDCTLGPREYSIPDKPCAWVADNRCYDTREMACNCACPRSHNSQCVSGFDDGPDGHVWVACN
jgi:hypothetical protein